MIPTPSPTQHAAPPKATRGGRWTALWIVILAAILSWLAVARLQNPRYPLDVTAAVTGVRETAAATVPAALAVGAVALVAIGAVTIWLRRRDDDLSLGEAAAGALVLLWAGTYLCLLTLGPTGLYRPTVLRALLLLVVMAALADARRRGARRSLPAPPDRPATRGTRRRSRIGLWITALAIGLSFGPMLLLQLASPVSPFMDILPYVASVQKIVTFHFYDPFGNDAAGLWAPSRQVAGCDALFSFVGLVAGVSGNLAVTALMVPLALAQIAVFYLLGRVIAGRLAGGMATLFLLETFIWRRTLDGRGTALAFVLVAIGLALLLARRRSAVRTALAGLAFGVAVAVNPLIGACGMQVAAAAVVLAWFDLGLPLLAPAVALAGASVLALPQVLIGLGVRVSPFLLPLAVVGGAALVIVAGRLAEWARARRAGRVRARAWPVARVIAIAALPLFVLFEHAVRRAEFFGDEWFGYSILLLLGGAGLLAGAYDVRRHPRKFAAAAVPALAIWVALLDHGFADPRRFAGPLAIRSIASEVTTKMVYYWTPYWAALAAGVWFAMLARRWGRGPTLALALVLVIYPLRHVPEELDFDTAQLTVAETWAFNLTNAARGYFAGYPDRRWVVDAHWRAVGRVLLDEVAAGRIRYDTHVLTISTSIGTIEPALATGISIDLVTPQYDPNSIWNVGGRVRGLDALPAAFAARPPYVLLHDEPPERFPALAAYEPLFVSDRTLVYRLRPPGAAEPATPATAVSDAIT
jgi:hypothetical protein